MGVTPIRLKHAVVAPMRSCLRMHLPQFAVQTPLMHGIAFLKFRLP
jgi:hypothetical protein